MSTSLTDVYNSISAKDAEVLEKHAAQIKLAEEEDAAGRIMARGFADELDKLARNMGGGPQAITGQRPMGTGASDPAVRPMSAPGGKMKELSANLPKPPAAPKPAMPAAPGAPRVAQR